ncbi:amino acid ABC transporter ATP-binding protein [Brevibacillus ruminantium]|uniref:Amino acid ABC transporter ATP-binding protein n=1 Tax=Brevibacillus ruminantium TaxID=2950604 RepID=A0ABY4WGX6_9BACL|nr:amino acid ABC transporter ATP-binding protein [Brevibacillus ruminantium]USG65095.1 amino acid ABC transporter ATP-binding protein [Brevibacillus ruminantium]
MISIKNVTKSFGTVTVLHDINLEIPQSQVFALIGPSGAGKSTLIRTINALEDIQAGEIVVDGTSVHEKKTDINKLRANIGFVFQSFNLYPHLTALENVAVAPINVKGVGKKEAEEKGKELLSSLGLGEKFGSYPGQLSGGQQQRVAIARALAMDPKVMLFDEPTSALDPEMVKEVLDAIRKLAGTGMTMAVVTHEMGFAKEICNQIVFMAEGKIVEVAPPSEFFSNPKTDRAQDFLGKVLNH